MEKRMYFYFILLIVFISGCQSNPENNSTVNQNRDQSLMDIGDKQNLKNTDIANHLANVATNVPNVNHANAVVAGPYAVVGIDVDGDLDRSRVGTIKYSVSEALQHDPYGKTAFVIADADVTERVQAINDKIKQGHPIRGIIDELAAIIGRYMPELPVPEEQPQDQNENKEISPDNKEELEDLEKEHSTNE